MKTTTLLKALPLLLSIGVSTAQTTAERLEQGVQLQTAEGDLKAAIEEYKAVLKVSAKSQRLAAEARYRLVECFLTLGNQDRVQFHLAALRADFPADNKWVVKAQELFPANTNFEGAPWKDGRIFKYEVKLPNGKVAGRFLLAERLHSAEPNEVWESIFVRGAGSRSISRTRFATQGYQALNCRWYLEEIGDAEVRFGKEGQVTVLNVETGEETGNYQHQEGQFSELPLYENEQVVQLMRALKQDVGTEQSMVLIAGINGGMPINFDLKVTEHLDLETKAGTFPCAKIETNIGQTFYIARTEERPIVRMKIGAVRIDLESSEDWDDQEGQKFQAKPFVFEYEMPGQMLLAAEGHDESDYQATFFSSDFAGRHAVIDLTLPSKIPAEAGKSAKAYAEHLHQQVAKKFDEFEIVGEWQELDINDVKGVAVRLQGKTGELVTHEYHVTAVTPECAMSFYIAYAAPDEKKAIARAKEIVKSFQF